MCNPIKKYPESRPTPHQLIQSTLESTPPTQSSLKRNASQSPPLAPLLKKISLGLATTAAGSSTTDQGNSDASMTLHGQSAYEANDNGENMVGVEYEVAPGTKAVQWTELKQEDEGYMGDSEKVVRRVGKQGG